ncbi:cystathionine beta-lyase [Virgibacillus natechei]|uniref:cysteine-S-conjugate beta-lyase n=1 Tax=Virgibacillus natechei TaxID=1216297 RepID=A0ABS4IF27_9BACI|nr:MalY/PatB family protein [Virgibacillus natechei]MBP1969542.1 cystathionine beta-lyase [Virgibacillus natechei]UZD11757.1 pyridoxal phosphate-dependent aminotransferase [Virgibacillus natechei]
MSIFKEIHDRKNTRSVKWDMLKPVFQTDDVLPMWVADMDFKAPEAVNEALVNRAKHGIYGYTIIDDDVTNSIINWIRKRHNWDINKNWLSFSPGVVTSLHIAIQAFTEPSDKILIQTPVYTPFYKMIEQHDRELVKNTLVLEDNYYTIDFTDFEEKLKQGVKAFILCSPHNPVGRVWKEDELQEMARLCLKYDVLILTDEIHADLIYPGEQHIPIASLSEEIAEQTITCMSPSKTFNLAGLQASYIITSNKEKRDLLNDHLSKQGHNMLNTMGNTAMEAAYLHGEAWLDELRTVLKENQAYVSEMLENHTNELKVTQTEGTYLLWIDCSGLDMDNKTLNKFMIEKAKVGLNTGAEYGKEGDSFMRMNIACPKATVVEGVKRIIDAVNNR